MRQYLDAVYAYLLGRVADGDELDAILNEPLPEQMTEEEARLAEMKRIATRNARGIAALGGAPA